MTTPPEVDRVILYVRWADGTITEFDAERPEKLEFAIDRPVNPRKIPRDSPFLIESARGPASVSLTFRASRQHDIAQRAYSTAYPRDAILRRLGLLRAGVETFLAQYGDSTRPMFGVARDLASSLLNILDGKLDET